MNENIAGSFATFSFRRLSSVLVVFLITLSLVLGFGFVPDAASAKTPVFNRETHSTSSQGFGVTGVQMNAFGYFEFERHIETQKTPHKFFGAYLDFDWRIPSWAKEGDYFTLKFDDSINLDKTPMYSKDETVPYSTLDKVGPRYEHTTDNKLGVITTKDSEKEAGGIPILNMYYTKIGEVTFVVQKIANRKGAMSGEGTIGKQLDKSKLLAYSDSHGRHVHKEKNDKLNTDLREVNDLEINKKNLDFYVGVTPNLRKFNVENGARHLKDQYDENGQKYDDYTFVRDIVFTTEYMADGIKREIKLPVQINFRTFMLHVWENKQSFGKDVIFPVYEDRTHMYFDYIYNARRKYPATGGRRSTIIQPLIINGRDHSRRSAFIEDFEMYEGDPCNYDFYGGCTNPDWQNEKYAPVPTIGKKPLKTGAKEHHVDTKSERLVHSFFGWEVTKYDRTAEDVEARKNVYNKILAVQNHKEGQDRIIYAKLKAKKDKVVNFGNGFVGHGVRMNVQHAGEPSRYQDIFFSKTSSFGSGNSDILETDEEDSSLKFFKVDENFHPVRSEVARNAKGDSFILTDKFGDSYEKKSEGTYADEHGFSLKQRRSEQNNALLFKDSLGRHYRLEKHPEGDKVFGDDNKLYSLQDGTTDTYIAADGSVFYPTRPVLYLDDTKLKIVEENGEFNVYDEKGTKLEKINRREKNAFQVLGRFHFSLLVEYKNGKWVFSHWVYDPHTEGKYAWLQKWDYQQNKFVNVKKIGTWETLPSRQHGDVHHISGINYSDLEIVPKFKNPIEFALTNQEGEIKEKQPVDEYGYAIIKNYVKGSYQLKETLPVEKRYNGLPNGYKVNVNDAGEITIQDGNNQNVTSNSYPLSVLDVAKKTYRVVNKPKTKIVVQKVDQSGNKINTAAAKFKLYRADSVTVDASGVTVKQGVKGIEIVTQQGNNIGDSKEFFVDPAQKDWVLVETEPPAGYFKAKPVKLKLNTFGQGEHWNFRWTLGDVSPEHSQWYGQDAVTIEPVAGIIVSVKNTKALADVTVNYTAGNNPAADKRIYSTDREISGTGIPGATVIIRDGEKELGKTTVNQERVWKVQLKRGVASTHRVDNNTLKPASSVTVEQKKGGAASFRVPVGVELGPVQIEPFAHGEYKPNKLVAGQKTVQLKVPHDARIVYVRLNDNQPAKEFNLQRSRNDKNWRSSRRDIQVRQTGTDKFYDTVTLTFNTANSDNNAFVLANNKKLFAVPHLNNGVRSTYAEVSRNHQALAARGEGVDGFWVTREVTNAKPVVLANPASFAAGAVVTRDQLLKSVRVTDEEDDIADAVIAKANKKKILVTKIVHGDKTTQYNENQQDNVTLQEPGVYKVTFQAIDSQGLASEPVEVEITVGVPKLSFQPTNGKTGQDGRIYSTDDRIKGAGGYPNAALQVTLGDEEIGRGTVGQDGSWNVKLDKGAISNWIPKASKAPNSSLTVKTPAALKVIQTHAGASNVMNVGVELGSALIEPFNKNSVAPRSVIAGQKELFLKVPHDAGIVYVDINGNKFSLNRSKSDLSAWTVSANHDATIQPDGVRVETVHGKFHDTLKVTFTKPSFVLKYDSNNNEKNTVKLVSQLYAGDQSWSLYATNPAKKAEITSNGQSIERRWITRPVTNTAPTISKKPVTTFESIATISNKSLLDRVQLSDPEDDLKPAAVVEQENYPKMIVTKIASGSQVTNYDETNQEQAQLDINKPGRYYVTFKGYDSQGLISENEITEAFNIRPHNATAKITPTVPGMENSILSTDGTISGTGARPGSRVVIRDKSLHEKGPDGLFGTIGMSEPVGEDGRWTVQLTRPLMNTTEYAKKEYWGDARPEVSEVYSVAGGEYTDTAQGNEFAVVLGHAFMEYPDVLKDTHECKNYILPPEDKPNDIRRACLVEGQKELYVNVPHDAKAFALRGLRQVDKEARGVSFYLQGNGNWQAKYGKNAPRRQRGTLVDMKNNFSVETVSQPAQKINGQFFKRVRLTFKDGADISVKTNAIRFYTSATPNKSPDNDGDIDTANLNYFENGYQGQGRCYDDKNRGMYCFTPTNKPPTLKIAKDTSGEDQRFSVPAGGLNREALVSAAYVNATDREDDLGLTISKVKLPEGADKHDYPQIRVCSITQNPGSQEQTVTSYKGCQNTTSAGVEQSQVTLAANGHYDVVMQAVDSQGAWSETVTLSFDPIADLRVVTVDQIVPTAVKGAYLTVYKDTDRNGEFNPHIDQPVAGTTAASRKTISDGGSAVRWDGLPAGTYFVQVDPNSRSKYEGFVHKIEHKAADNADQHKLLMPRAKTTVTWTKIAKGTLQNPLHLSGSHWCILPVRNDANDSVAEKLTLDHFGFPAVKDSASECAGGVFIADKDTAESADLPANYVEDVDERPGHISVALPWVNYGQWYVLKEVKAPALYQLTTEQKRINVASNGEQVSFQLNSQGEWEFDVDTVAIENERIPAVGVTLDPGWRYLFFGLVLVGVVGSWFAWAWRRRIVSESSYLN